MSVLEQLAREYSVSEDIIRRFAQDRDITLNGAVPEKDYRSITAYLEGLEGRLEKALHREKPHFQSGDGRVRLFRDDAIRFLRKLPSASVDVLVTDPAYAGMNNRLKLGKGRIVGRYENKGTENGKWFSEFQDTEANYTAFLSECRRVLKAGTGHIYIMFDSFSLLSLGPLVRDFFDVKNLITWDKVNPGMGHYFRRRHEYILFATNGNNRKLSKRSFPDVWQFKRIHGAAYPTQKPVEVFQAMLFASAQAGFVVCDPFVGSGSSAIAALKNDCVFVGNDISEKALSLAADRIDRYLRQGVDPYQKKSARVADKIFWE